MKRLLFGSLVLLLSAWLVGRAGASRAGGRPPAFTAFAPLIPRTWDSLALAAAELPLATATASPRHVPAAYYYQLPERVAYTAASFSSRKAA